jgi:aminoglycoside 6'-N-acetyltransferase
MTSPVLVGQRVVLRPGRHDDVTVLVGIFASNAVARWWPGEDAASLGGLLAGVDGDLVVWVVEVDGEVIGLAQAYEEPDPQYRHAGIDLALAAEAQGRGLGPEVVGVVVSHLVERGHHRVVIDPNASNARAIRAYEKAGFRRVGTMRSYEWDPTREAWTDGVLMEWVADT